MRRTGATYASGRRPGLWNTHSRLATEPTTKPTFCPPRHWSRPAWTAGTASAVATEPASTAVAMMMVESRIVGSPRRQKQEAGGPEGSGVSKTRRFRKLPSKHQDHYVACDLTSLLSTRRIRTKTYRCPNL